MNIIATKIKDLYVIEGLRFTDSRGELLKPFSESFLKKNSHSINSNFKEIWFTKSHKDVIRAMHLQIGEHACEKLVSVINGAVLDVVLDIRPKSVTYGQYLTFELNDMESKSLYIPKGCAHGYKVLLDNSITLYMATDVHDAINDVGIKWDSFGFDWDILNPIMSEKDKNLPTFHKS
jgi:dTDP-4-dehydrorhamnose 3,5-epimerase